MPGSGALPNLIIIGAQKCGTTSLHNYLNAHPEISMCRRKQTDFFLEEGSWDRGVDWYARQFDPAARVRGEASPDYTNLPTSEGTAQRMHKVVPRAKLLYLVRDPLDRMVSHYVHTRAAGREARSFAAALAAPDNEYVARSRYASQLQPFLLAFSREQIRIETRERLLHDRVATLRRIFEFVGADDSFVSAEFELIWERSEGKGSLYTLAQRVARQTRKRGIFLPQSLRWPVQRLLRSRLGDRKVERPAYSDRLRELMRARLGGEVEQLRELTGLKLPDWSI